MRPRILDLFCGAGGCAVGYHRAGFDVVGVDIKPQPNYPFEFVQADALEFLANGGHDGRAVRSSDHRGRVGGGRPRVGADLPSACREDRGRHGDQPQLGAVLDSRRFDAIHTSPPCQGYSVANNIHGRTDHPLLIADVRTALIATGLPYVIENVEGAKADMLNPITICGLTLGLNVRRHRLFECSFPVMTYPCGRHEGDWLLVFGHSVLERGTVVGKAKGGGNTIKRLHTTTARGREAMGIDWMNRDELSEAVPPAYTEHIGGYLMAELEARAAA